MPFFKFAANLDPSECEGRQNARLRVRFDEIFASLPTAGRLFIEWKRKSQSGLRTKDSDEQYVLFFFTQQYEVIRKMAVPLKINEFYKARFRDSNLQAGR